MNSNGFMHPRVAMYGLISTRFLLIIYVLSVIQEISTQQHKSKRLIIFAFRERDKPSWSVLWQHVLISLLRHYPSRNLWRHALRRIVLFYFRILNTYPYNIAIKYGAYCQRRSNHLEDSRRQKSRNHPDKESRGIRKHGFAVYKNHGQLQKTQGENLLLTWKITMLGKF